jgi:DNA-binding PadR family transcriptional regulator
MKTKKNKPLIRKKKQRIEDITLSNLKEHQIETIAKALTKQVAEEISENKYIPIKVVLLLASLGVFTAATLAIPTLPAVLKPFLATSKKDYEVWKRFNIPYLKRILNRLHAQKLIEIGEENDMQIVRITEVGKRRILRYSLDKIVIQKPKKWDKKWRLVSYDIPLKFENLRNRFREYLRAWGFFPYQESVFIHAYTCEKQVDFLREYFGISEHVRILIATKIEHDTPFRKFFGIKT